MHKKRSASPSFSYQNDVSQVLFAKRFTIYLSNLPPNSGEQPSSISVHGLATRKVYQSFQITLNLVSPYLTFHPYLCPETIGGLNFYSTFCNVDWSQRSFLLRSAALYVVWTFLSRRSDEFTCWCLFNFFSINPKVTGMPESRLCA